MNRRNFFGALSAVVASGAMMMGLRSKNTRYVMFSPPSEPPTFYWQKGHVPVVDFMRWWERCDSLAAVVATMQAAQVKQGWATFGMSSIGVYLSDTPQANMEPVTYWIPSDHGA